MDQQEKQRKDHAEGKRQNPRHIPSEGTMESKPKAHLFAFAVMTLFIFVFLGSEYHFDIAYGELAGPDSVVGAQASILAASAIGLVGYSLVNRTAATKRRSILAGMLGTASTLLVIATQLTQNASTLLSLGCLLFLILGMLGNATYFSVALTHFASRSLSRLVGTSYAAGLLAQFLLHSLAPNSIVEAAIIGVSAIALGFVLAARRNVLHVIPVEGTLPEEDQRTADERAALKEAILLLVCVSLIACVFSTLDNVVTLANAQGTFDLSTWPRLLLAASAIAAGFAFDLTNHRYSTITMLCVAMLSLVSGLAIRTDSEVLLGLVIFYLSSGFFVVFFTSSFLRIAMRCANPSLWAGMGRAANNVCASLVAIPSMSLISSGDIMLISSITIALAMATLLVAHALENVRRTARHKAEIEALKLAELTAAQATNPKPETAAETEAPIEESAPDSHLAAFSERYSLTPRERDVLSAVCSSEETLQCIADDMGISLRALQKHLTSIYRKSDTQSRAGLCSAALTESLER